PTGYPNATLAPGHRGILRTDNLWVELASSATSGVPELWCYYDSVTPLDKDCLPSDNAATPIKIETFPSLLQYIAGEPRWTNDDTSIGIDGWYRKLALPRERNLSQATLLGGLITFTSYQPFESSCKAEGEGLIYGLHYQTGTAWKEKVFGLTTIDGNTYVDAYSSTGTGLSGTASLYTGDPPVGDAKAFVQTSTGEILELSQENLPYQNFKSGRSSWIFLDK
ncbi:MAG: hypothetical protein OEV64_08410, partial [Desulfobulbaceae bacterium]|nr:hypothetical protein [Desulfobulbaceae bacterium]